MKSTKTILAALTMQIEFAIQKAKFPIVVSVKQPQQEVSFDGFRDMQQCLSTVAAIKVNPQPIKLCVKLKNNIHIERIDFGVVFHNQSNFFRDILKEKREEIRKRAINQWNDKKIYINSI